MLNRTTLAVIFGTVTVFYDFVVFAYISSYIADLFFPESSHYTKWIMTYGIYASGNISRPLGGVLFGFIGDKYGRSIALIISIWAAAIITFLMAILPTYSQIGIFAPILLSILRLMQGCAVSGEEGVAATYLAEFYGKKRLGYSGALVISSIFSGILLGGFINYLLTLTCSNDFMLKFGWRIPLLFSLILSFITLYLRSSIKENIDFKELKKSNNPTILLFKNYSSISIKLSLVAAVYAVVTCLYMIFLPNFLVSHDFYTKHDVLMINVIGLLLVCFFVPIFGRVVDSLNPTKCLKYSLAFSVVMIKPSLLLILSGNNNLLFLGYAFLALIMLSLASTLMPAILSNFPPEVRSSGVGLVFNLSIAIFSGGTPIFLTYIYSLYSNSEMICDYALFLSICGLLAFLSVNKVKVKKSADSNQVLV